MHYRCSNFLWLLGVSLVVGTPPTRAAQVANGRPAVVLENRQARLVLDLKGGTIADFHLLEHPVNPLNWGTPKEGDMAIRGFGHFLCLDRWGPPSEAEGAKGMPYHGEASRVEWSTVREPAEQSGGQETQLSAVLAKAGLMIKRTVRLASGSAVFRVEEEVTNQNPLGRMLNMVQHPTVGPPFLDETTVVDCNGRQGFAQGGSLPNPELPSFFWPQALTRDGESVNLRRLTTDPHPNVVSYTIDGSLGWVTAATPGQQLLIGYVWRTSDYPWVSLWRDVRNGKPSARGLEFGTTGLHQPFSVLAKKGQIWERPLFEYLDAGQSLVRRYLCFLLRVPKDFAGVESLRLDKGKLVLQERGRTPVRDLALDLHGLALD